jgi:hypothetical protein
VRGAHDSPDARPSSPHLLEHRLAIDRVGSHDLGLGRVERAGFVEDLLRDPDLADVVQQRAELHVLP